MRPPNARSIDAAALAVILAAVVLAFADILFFHRTFYVRDVARFFYPNFVVLRDALRSGAFPLWTSRYNAGQPFAANPAYAALYPPQWLAALLPGTLGFRLDIVAHYLLAATGMYALLRSMRLRPPAALFGALSFGFGGLMLSLSNLVNVLFGVAWFPWLLLALRRNAALAALVLGIILLTGDQAVILQAGFLVVATTVRSRRSMLLCAMIVLAAIAVGSVQIVPALDHQRDSARSLPIPRRLATQWTLPAVRPLELALPSFAGTFRDYPFYWAGQRFYPQAGVPWIFSFYSGLLVFVLACGGFVRRVEGWATTAIVMAVSYVLAVVPLLYLIGFRSIRYPEKFFIAAVFMLIIFAATAADRIVDDERLRAIATLIAFVVAVAAASWLALMTPSRFAGLWHLSGYYGDLFAEARAAAIVTVATAAVLTLILGGRRRLPAPLWAALLAAFVVADLAPRIAGLTPRIDAGYFDPPPVAQGLRGARVYNDADWRLALIAQPHIPVEQRPWRLRNAMLTETQAIWGIDAVLENDITLTNLLPSVAFSRAFWKSQLSGGLVASYLRWAGVTHVIELRDATSAVNPVRIIRLDHPRYAFLEPASHVVKVVEHQNDIDLDVETREDSALMLAVTRHKYWRAAIDGTPAALQPANIAFQALNIPPGRHHVALRYRNPLIALFAVVSALSVVTLVVVALRSKAPPQP